MGNELRVQIFIFGLVLFSILEFFISYRKRDLPRIQRWPHNFIMIFIGSLAAKLIFPLGMGAISTYTKSIGLGLFNFFEIPFIIEILLSIFILDFAVYLQHLIFHKVHFLWRFHRVHHSDIDLDTTSALRFHPIEIIISLIYKCIWILAFGFSLESILIFEIILNFMAMFNHSNIYIPARLEKVLRIFIVTPQMHIIHHSVEQYESDTNYGFNFSFWDRALKTYSKKFTSSGMIGNKRFRTSKEHNILEILKQPFSS